MHLFISTNLLIRLSTLDTWGLLFYRGAIPFVVVLLSLVLIYRSKLIKLVFYKGKQRYGNNYFTNLKEFLDFCPFRLLTKVEINNNDFETIETSSIFII